MDKNEVVYAEVEADWILSWLDWDGLKFDVLTVGEGEDAVRTVRIRNESDRVQEFRIDELVKHLNLELYHRAEKIEKEAKEKEGQMAEPKTLGINVAEKINVSERIGKRIPKETVVFNGMALLMIDMVTGEKKIVRSQLIKPDGGTIVVPVGTTSVVTYTVVNK